MADTLIAPRYRLADEPILRIERVIVDPGPPGQPPIRRQMTVEEWARVHGADVS